MDTPDQQQPCPGCIECRCPGFAPEEWESRCDGSGFYDSRGLPLPRAVDPDYGLPEATTLAEEE